MDRNEKAAKVILKRATLGQRGSYAHGERINLNRRQSSETENR